MKKILFGAFAFVVCCAIALTSANAWSMSFDGSDGYYKSEQNLSYTKFHVVANKMRHMSGGAVRMQIKGWNWVLVGYVFPEGGVVDFNTTSLNQYKWTTYNRSSTGKAKGEWSGMGGGIISADFNFTSKAPS